MSDRLPEKSSAPFPRVKLSAVKGEGLGVLGRNIGRLPKRGDELRFVVTSPEGFCSLSWGIKVKRDGDVYIFPRNGRKGYHVSLHASGTSHVRVDQEGRRAAEWTFSMNQPAFHLLLASWGISHSPHKDPKNEIVLESRGGSVAVTIVKADGHPLLLPYKVTPLGCLTPANCEWEVEEHVWIVAYRIKDPIEREEMERWVGAGYGGRFLSLNHPDLRDGMIFNDEIGGVVGDGAGFVLPFQTELYRGRS